MEAKDAIRLFNSKNPNKKIRGYWETPNSVIICIMPPMISAPDVCLYEVKSDGQIIPTNPIHAPITIDKPMTKVR